MWNSQGATIGAALLLAAASASAAQDPPAEPPTIVAPPVQPIAGCVPPGLFRAVMRDISPGVAASDRRAQPRTLYRQGAIYLRSEEQPDPTRGDQTVLVIAEPDVWVWSLTSRTGRHSVDPGPDLVVHAPIVPIAGDVPVAFRTLEFGCEAAFVAAYAPAEQRVVPWGASMAALHGLTVGDQTVAILMDQRRNSPLLISYLRQGKPVMVIRYDDYRVGQKERPELFMPPKGVQMSESPTPSPPQSPPTLARPPGH